jgi:NTP pyrophosphatase (non-canonical NTP hydrolase)
MDMLTAENFIRSFYELQRIANDTAISKGFWETPREEGTLIALMHSELSEALEAVRHGNPPDDKIPEFSGVEAEFADVIIRIMDYAGYHDLNVAGAVIAKMEYNPTRPYKHGKQL